MSTLNQIRQNLARAWDNLAEGWNHLQHRASRALTRFNPIQHKDEVETVADQAMRMSSRWGLLAAEIEEKDDEIVVRLEAPGMEKDDFDIQVEDEYLVVRGKKYAQREQSHGHYTVMETAYGEFERILELPAPVQADKAKAKYRRGVLSITLPLAETARRRRIEIQRG